MNDAGRLIVRPPHGPRRDIAIEADVLTIGRSADCDVMLDVAYLSRVHARIERHEFGYVVVDNGSTNGTYVNGKRLSAPHRLASGDHIALADVSITFLASAAEGEGRTLAISNESPVRCDADTREVWVDREKLAVRLSSQECQLLLLLISDYGRVCPRDELAMAIWGEHNYDYNMLHRLVHRLKAKLAARPDLLRTIVGVGYAIGAERPAAP